MQSQEQIKNIITKALFNLPVDKLPPFWQNRVNAASTQVYLHMLKPLKMINSVLLDEAEKLKKENLSLRDQIQTLRSKQSATTKNANNPIL